MKSQIPYLISLENYSRYKLNKYWYGIHFAFTTWPGKHHWKPGEEQGEFASCQNKDLKRSPVCGFWQSFCLMALLSNAQKKKKPAACILHWTKLDWQSSLFKHAFIHLPIIISLDMAHFIWFCSVGFLQKTFCRKVVLKEKKKKKGSVHLSCGHIWNDMSPPPPPALNSLQHFFFFKPCLHTHIQFSSYQSLQIVLFISFLNTSRVWNEKRKDLKTQRCSSAGMPFYSKANAQLPQWSPQ